MLGLLRIEDWSSFLGVDSTPILGDCVFRLAAVRFTGAGRDEVSERNLILSLD